jgi:hypothetical protein
MKSGNLNFLEPSGALHACNGTALPLPRTNRIEFGNKINQNPFVWISFNCMLTHTVKLISGDALLADL